MPHVSLGKAPPNDINPNFEGYGLGKPGVLIQASARGLNIANAATQRYAAAILVALGWLAALPMAHASDHLDSPAAVANPAADIADIYAWAMPDGQHLGLVMTIQVNLNSR